MSASVFMYLQDGERAGRKVFIAGLPVGDPVGVHLAVESGSSFDPNPAANCGERDRLCGGSGLNECDVCRRLVIVLFCCMLLL